MSIGIVLETKAASPIEILDHIPRHRGGAQDVDRQPEITQSPDIITRQAQQAMVARGRTWQKIDNVIGLDRHEPIKELSNRNTRILSHKLGRMSSNEQKFYKCVMSQPWFMTHFCSTHTFQRHIQHSNHTVVLKSADQRQSQTAYGSVHTNAAPCDINEFAGTDFVYFCVELGKGLKKSITRSPGDGSGTTIIRTPLRQDATRNAMSYHGDIFDGLRVDSRLPLKPLERDLLNNHLRRFEENPTNDDNGFARTVFSGPKAIKAGTTKQVILDLRQLPEPTRRNILSCRTSDDLNTIISSMSRTQVLVAKEFSTSKYELYKIDAS